LGATMTSQRATSRARKLCEEIAERRERFRAQRLEGDYHVNSSPLHWPSKVDELVGMSDGSA
jgi:hypothetical protein